MEDISIENLTLTEADLSGYGIWENYKSLREQLVTSAERGDCVLVQGAAFVLKGKAFLLLGVGGIDFLDSLGHLVEVDGIIGNGNALFLSKDCGFVYSAHTQTELENCYELENTDSEITFLESAPLAPLIFLFRSCKNREEYDRTKAKVSTENAVIFEAANTFCAESVRFAGSLKARLRGKFLATTRVVHCARRPTLMKKECLFDSRASVCEVINRFKGQFALVYTLWSQELCDAVGMRNTRSLTNTYNPTDPITPHLLTIANGFLDEERRTETENRSRSLVGSS